MFAFTRNDSRKPVYTVLGGHSAVPRSRGQMFALGFPLVANAWMDPQHASLLAWLKNRFHWIHPRPPQASKHTGIYSLQFIYWMNEWATKMVSHIRRSLKILTYKTTWCGQWNKTHVIYSRSLGGVYIPYKYLDYKIYILTYSWFFFWLSWYAAIFICTDYLLMKQWTNAGSKVSILESNVGIYE
jgi:hypothetical protein